MRLDAVAGEVLLVVVRVAAQEGVIALETQLLGGGVQTEADDEGRLRDLLGVHQLEIAFGDLAVLDHAVKDYVGHEIGDDPFARDIGPVGELDAVHLFVTDVDLFDLGIVPEVAAELPDSVVKCH